MRYIVTGFARTGTSLMMRMLAVSDIKPYYDRLREQSLKMLNKKDYLVNEEFLEVGRGDYGVYGFTRTVPDGMCVKLGLTGVAYMSGGIDQKVILMCREPENIRTSFKRAIETADFDKLYPRWPRGYHLIMGEAESIMQVRSDVEFIKVDYHDLIQNPVEQLERLRAAGIPVDVEKAISLIDKNLYRHRAA